MVQSALDHRGLLARCAMLRRFDRELLRDMFGCDDAAAGRLLARPEIEPFAGAYRVRPDLAGATSAGLLAQEPGAEAELHQRAFEVYLGRVRRRAAGGLDDEDECLHHFAALFATLATRMQWQTMRRLALQGLRARPRRPAHLQRLHMAAGYAAVWLHRHALGEQALARLLEGDIDEPDVRLKALKALADSFWFRSRYSEALVGYEQLHQAAVAAGDVAYQGLALLNRSIVFHELEAYDRALDDCERSLAIFRELGDETRQAHALYHAALFTLHLGRWDAARDYCATAEAQFERLGLHAYLGFISWCQGLLAHVFGDEAASEAAYLRGLAIAEAAGGAQLSLALDVRVNLGVLCHTRASYGQALDHYGRALAHALRLDRQHQICLIHFRRGQVFERLGRPGRAFLAYRTAIRCAERMGGDTAREDVKISLLGTTQQIYEAMVLRCVAFFERSGRPAWVARALGYVERARSRAFLDSLAQRAPLAEAIRAEAAAPAGLAEIQAALPPDALLIEYFTTGVQPRGEHLLARIPAANRRLRESLLLPPRTLAFAVSRGGCHLFSPDLDPNRLRPPVGARHPGRQLLLGPMPATLYQELIAPFAALLAGRRLLYLVPHGPLHYVPFAALRAPDGDSLLGLAAGGAEGGLALAQAPSATILVRSCLSRTPACGGRSLAIGFDDPQGPQPLRFAEAEAEHIAAVTGGEAWTGGRPKCAGLRAIGGELRSLHIAGHALFTPQDPLGSWLLLGADERLSARDIIDGVDLGADLVTLSACTSGVSHVVPGDELLGLPRALLYAGAATVICARWEAIDVVALLIMARFYAGLARHSPAVALRDAQVAVRDLTYAELERTLAAWAGQGGALAAAIGDPALLLGELALVSRDAGVDGEAAQGLLAPADPDARPFAAPLFWAPFMVIGRA